MDWRGAARACVWHGFSGLDMVSGSKLGSCSSFSSMDEVAFSLADSFHLVWWCRVFQIADEFVVLRLLISAGDMYWMLLVTLSCS